MVRLLMSEGSTPPPSQGPPGSDPDAITSTPAPEGYEPAPDPTAPPVPLDADDTRTHHFKGIATKTWVMSLIGTLALVALAVGSSYEGPAVGGGAGVAVILIGIVIIFMIASSKAEEDFYEHYATSRGLNRTGKGMLPPSTPLLRKGDKRYGEQIMNGTLPGGLPGALSHYTYEETSRDSDGHEQTEYYRFTVVMHDIPASARLVSEIHCSRRSGFRWMDAAEDIFRSMQRLELESEALDKRYEIFFGKHDSENWMKQLFSPVFIVWLTEQTPKDFAFELSAGSLVCNVKGHVKSAEEYDAICLAAAEVANRIVKEANE